MIYCFGGFDVGRGAEVRMHGNMQAARRAQPRSQANALANLTYPAEPRDREPAVRQVQGVAAAGVAHRGFGRHGGDVHPTNDQQLPVHQVQAPELHGLQKGARVRALAMGAQARPCRLSPRPCPRPSHACRLFRTGVAGVGSLLFFPFFSAVSAHRCVLPHDVRVPAHVCLRLLADRGVF